MDQSGLYAMEDVLQALQQKNVLVLLTGVLEQPQYMMERIDIIPDLIPHEHIFEHFEDCVNWLLEQMKNNSNTQLNTD